MAEVVAYQGVPGAYSESACLHLFGTGCRPLPCERFEDIYEAVLDGRADDAYAFMKEHMERLHERYWS